ncbi:hypothetical protein E2C01_028936 [Portunus trituberculatus]|uniref:Uncharacterized protein n=1 Tax=Portunus trituberculatus TaxID=210409 RepID=A0A5B7EMV0_PORTR|nr:hypothetical protein [Portunus trituberculatus]
MGTAYHTALQEQHCHFTPCPSCKATKRELSEGLGISSVFIPMVALLFPCVCYATHYATLSTALLLP